MLLPHFQNFSWLSLTLSLSETFPDFPTLSLAYLNSDAPPSLSRPYEPVAYMAPQGCLRHELIYEVCRAKEITQHWCAIKYTRSLINCELINLNAKHRIRIYFF